MSDWKLETAPEPYEIRYKNARYAILLVMGNDGDLRSQLHPDFYEMVKVVSEDVAVLALADYPASECSRVVEVLPNMTNPVHRAESICTGDPRPMADFLARALVSFTPETRFAIGFWGHGHGVFEDHDPAEIRLAAEERYAGDVESMLKSLAEAQIRATEQSMLLDETSMNSLTNSEARSALEAAFTRAGRTAPVDLLFFDTCLNGSVEVYAEMGRFAEVFVASSHLIAGTGWDYELWLQNTDEVRPKTAAEWANLAVKSYDVVYDQRTEEEPAHLVATRWEPELIETLGRLVKALLAMGEEQAQALVRAAGLRADSVVYEENLDLRQLVEEIRAAAEVDEVREAAERFLEVQAKARVSSTLPKPGSRELCGMTVWCPVSGDLRSVGRYYERLEFHRATGWGRLWSESGLGKRAL